MMKSTFTRWWNSWTWITRRFFICANEFFIHFTNAGNKYRNMPYLINPYHNYYFLPPPHNWVEQFRAFFILKLNAASTRPNYKLEADPEKLKTAQRLIRGRTRAKDAVFRKKLKCSKNKCKACWKNEES